MGHWIDILRDLFWVIIGLAYFDLLKNLAELRMYNRERTTIPVDEDCENIVIKKEGNIALGEESVFFQDLDDAFGEKNNKVLNLIKEVIVPAFEESSIQRQHDTSFAARRKESYW